MNLIKLSVIFAVGLGLCSCGGFLDSLSKDLENAQKNLSKLKDGHESKHGDPLMGMKDDPFGGLSGGEDGSSDDDRKKPYCKNPVKDGAVIKYWPNDVVVYRDGHAQITKMPNGEKLYLPYMFDEKLDCRFHDIVK